MPPNGPDEWRARIGHWENRKLRWYQAHCGSRPRVPLHLHLERVISEAPLLCVLLLFWLSGKAVTGVCGTGNGSMGKLVGKARSCVCGQSVRVWATPSLTLFLTLSLLLVVAGDVETNPGPISDEFLGKVDDSELTDDSLFEVYKEVYILAPRWSDICCALNLPHEETIRKETQGDDCNQCLRMVLRKWLQKSYNYQRCGPPSWKMLVEAVGDPAGGNNSALAETIANNHAAVSCKYKHYQGCSGSSETSAESICTFTEVQSIGDKWDLSRKFSVMLTEVAKLLDKSADVEKLKHFLKFFCNPDTCQRYIDIELYEHCRTPREIIEALFPQYIHYMHTHLLRQIVVEFGNQQSKTLLKQYEDNFPRKRPLNEMCEPLSDEEIESCPGTKKMKVRCDGGVVDTTVMEDFEKVQQNISRNTGIDESVIVYANQTEGSVIFTFLIPETVVSVITDLSEDSQRDLADHGILKIEVNDLIIDLQSLQMWTKTDVSMYTTTGMKRILLAHDSQKAANCNSELQQLISEVGRSLAESVGASELKEFLQSFSHILYPEARFIDSRLMKSVESLPHILTALQPHVINFLNWGVLRKAADAFSIKVVPAIQLYAQKFPPHTILSTLPDPLSEEEISDSKGFQRLRVTCSGGSGIQSTLADVQAVREAVEKATGIDQDFIIYAYWEGGFTTHQFTFLIPKSISGIFGELWQEDLTILARKGIQRLEIDYDTVADNIHVQLPQAVEPVTVDSRIMTKRFDLKDFIPEDEAERMSEEDFSHLNDLIESIPAGWLQETCSNDFLKVFVKKMGTWKDLAPYLGISELDLENLAHTYPGDDEEQKYVAFLNWKSIDVKSATYQMLVQCLLTHGHISDAKRLLLQFQGTDLQKALDILQQRFLNDSFSQRKLWSGAPKVSKFNRRFGIIQNVPLLSELDYTSCHEMMDQFSSEIQELSMKSMLNKIAQKESRVFLFKGPPGCGKTELMSRVCSYWARQYALREFSLVLYVNVWDLHRGCSFEDLIDRQFKHDAIFNEKICHWITEKKGHGILFILDGFCREYLYHLSLTEVDVLYDILSDYSDYCNSTVVVATTCSDFVEPVCCNYIQFDILGLSVAQMGHQVIQHCGKTKAVDFLSYLAENPEIKGLVSSPSYLLGTMYVFSRISYDDLPVTWTQLYTSLVVLVNEWHKCEHSKGWAVGSLQSHFKNTLLENSKQVIENSGDLLTYIGKALIHDAEDSDSELPDHNSAVPYLQYFLFALDTLLNPDHEKLLMDEYEAATCEDDEEDDAVTDDEVIDEDNALMDDEVKEEDDKKLSKAVMNKSKCPYFWYFLAGLGVEINCKKLLERYNILMILNCLSEAEYVTNEQQVKLSSLTAEVGKTIVTTLDIHSIFHCLPYLQDPHTVVLDKCFLGTRAVKQLSRYLAVEPLSNGHSILKNLSIRHTNLTSTGVMGLARALQHNKSLEEFHLERNRIGDSGATALASALRVNHTLKTLNLEWNGIGDSGAAALANTLTVNRNLKTLNLRHNNLTSTGAMALAKILQHNNSLEELYLERSGIGDSGATTLADALRVNQSLKILNLRHNQITATGAIALAKALQHNQSLEELHLNWDEYKWTWSGEEEVIALTDQRVFKNFETLNLSNNDLTATGAIALAKALQHNKLLEELNLNWDQYTWTGIGNEGVIALTDQRVIKNIKILNLQRSDLTTSGVTALATALKHSKSLEELNVQKNEIGDEGVTALADALRVNQSLKTLNLEWNRIEDSGATALADAVRVNQTLKRMYLCHNQLTDTGAITLIRALQQSKSLEKLNLEWSNGATALVDTLRLNQDLKTLNIEYIGTESIALQHNKSLKELSLIIGSEGASALASALRVNQNLTTLNVHCSGLTDTRVIFLASALQHNKSFKELNVQWNRIGDSGATALADALRVNQNLEILNLEWNRIGDSGATALSDALGVHQSLKTLNLGQNRIGESGATALSDALRVNQSLEILNLGQNRIGESGATALSDALRVNQSLEILNLEGNTIGESGTTALSDALRVNQSLKTLNLEGNTIGESGATALSDALGVNQSLEILNLKSNEIGHMGATALANALKVNQSLKTLNLEGNTIGESGATALSDALRVNQNLEILNLPSNEIGHVGATALASALRMNQSLQTLNLKSNGIGESGATALADALRVNQSLKTVNLEGNRIGDSGATALSDALEVNQSLEILKIGESEATALSDALGVNQSLEILKLGDVWGLSWNTRQLLRSNERIHVLEYC